MSMARDITVCRSRAVKFGAALLLFLAATILASGSDGEADLAPVWDELPTFYATEDEPLTVHLSPYVSDPDTPLSGLSLREDTGVPRISGLDVTVTFEGGGLISIILDLCDGANLANARVNFTVNGVNDPPRIMAVQLPDASSGEPYCFHLTATDPDDDASELRWSEDCALFDISPSGEIAFIPKAWDVGHHTFIATVVDLHGARDCVQLTLYIEGPWPAWSFSFIPPQDASEGEVFRLDLSGFVNAHPDAAPPDQPFQFTYSDDTIEVETDPESGILTWDRPTHEDVGDHYIIVKVQESHRSLSYIEQRLKVTVWAQCGLYAVDAGPDIWADQGADFYLRQNGSAFLWPGATFTWSYTVGGTERQVRGDNVRVNIERPGTYKVRLDVCDEDGCFRTDTRVVHVRDTRPPIAEAHVDSIVEAGKTIVLDGSRSEDNVGIVEYRWSVCGPDGWVCLTEPKVDFTFDIAGKYGVLFEVADAAGHKASMLLAVTAVDRMPPVAEAGWNRTVPLGKVAMLDARDSTDDMGIARFLWRVDGPDGSVNLEGALAPVVPTAPGKYTVTLTAMDDAGNVDMDTVTLWVPSDRSQGHGLGIGRVQAIAVAILVGGIALILLDLRRAFARGRA